jgi:hypothetical protein
MGREQETDPKFTYLVIELPFSINIPCTSERPESKSIKCRSTKQLQLFISSGSRDELELTAKKLQGRRATVRGTLKRQIAPGEMTAFYIEITAIESTADGL